MEGETIVEVMARETPHIYATQEDQQVAYQATLVRNEGKIAKKSISILIDLGSTHSYITPRIVESCLLK